VIYVLPLLVFAAAALMASGGRARRGLALGLVVFGMSSPWWLPPDWLALRALSTLGCIGGAIRCIDLVLLRETIGPVRRLGHAFSIVDSFALRARPPALAWRSLLRCSLFLVAAVGGRSIAFDVAPNVRGDAASLGVRWLGGLLFIYAGSELAYALADVIYRALGFAPPALHRDPILSRTVREFWGFRWNRIISGWLDVRVYRPLARRGRVKLGMAAAFVVSALIHFYVAYPPLGPRWALIWASYFLLQGVVALIEGPLGVSRWRPVVAHAWTIAWMTVTSPIMSEAFLRVMARWP
jgi:hypothetical protein